MKEKNITNISSELRAIDRQIKYFEELKYYNNPVSCGGGQPYPLSGLDEEEFYKIKNKIIEMLEDCHNKKSDEIIELCQINKIARDHLKQLKCTHDWVVIKSCSDTFHTINTYKCVKCGETKTLSMGI